MSELQGVVSTGASHAKPSDDALARVQDELRRMGFAIKDVAEDSLVATRQKWHWDCLATKLTYVVFVRRVATVNALLIESDRRDLEQRASQLDPSRLPRGFQKGVAVLTAYLADEALPDARELCDEKPKVKFAFFYVPGVRDLAEHDAHFVRSTPAWGALYYGKFRWILGRILEPESTRPSETLSVGGSIFGLLLAGLLALQLALVFS